MNPETPLKLKRLNDDERQILKLVVEEYYAVLPPALKVHSLFATHILSHTLHRFGIRTRVLPCRLWCSSLRSPPLPQARQVVGGVLNYWAAEKWNGHVICLVGDWLVDAALYHLNPNFNYEVPKIIARRIITPEPGIYTRYQLNKKTEFIWYRLPAAVPAVTVTGYEDYIDRFVDTLFDHIRRLLGYVDEVPADADAATDEMTVDPVSAEGEATSDEVLTIAGEEEVPSASPTEGEDPAEAGEETEASAEDGEEDAAPDDQRVELAVDTSEQASEPEAVAA